MRDLGLFDSKLGLIIFYSAMFFPLSFVIQRAFLAGLPYEIEEAAIIDGSTTPRMSVIRRESRMRVIRRFS